MVQVMKDLPLQSDAVGLFTVKEFCRWANIGRTKLYSELSAGRLAARKIGSRTLIPRIEAQKWLEQLPFKQ